MVGMSAANGDVLKLNISGTKMEVTRALLTSVKGSKLAARFSGQHKVKEPKAGEYFLDRDAEIFGIVLNFLRNDC